MDKKEFEDAYAVYAASRQTPPEKTVSAAKAIEPQGLEGTALNRANVTPEFNRTAADRQPDPKPADRGIGSQMVAKDAPRHNLTPPPAMRGGPDAQAHSRNLAADEARFEQLRAALEARQARQENGKMKDGRDREQERD